jgi:peptide/nickel transport system substrate-binding protein
MKTRTEIALPSPSRRGLLLGGAAALAAGALGLRSVLARRAVGSGPESLAPPRSGGELVVAFDGTATSTFMLDPHNSGFAPQNRVMRSIYDNLTLLWPDQTVGPWLAESWDISPDRKTYVFKLRRDVKFHDGTAFDATAVKANFDRLRDPTKALYSKACLGPVVSSEVIADDRLRVTLSEPFTPLLRNLSMTKLAIVSPAAVAKHGEVYGQNPVGTGPFRFIGLTQGTEIRLERNPDYRWGPSTAANPGPAHLERLIFRNVPEESTRVAVLMSGQAQAADLIPPQNLPSFRDNPGYRLLEKELLNTNYSLALNVAKAPWDDEEVRLAVRLSLDIDTIVKTIYLGTLPRAWSPLSPSMFGSGEKDLAHSWKSDPARAIAILAGKGWTSGAGGIREKDGKSLKISFIDTQGNREKRLDVIQLVRHQLAATGIALSLDSEALGAYTTKIANNDYDLAGGASFHSDPDILRQAYLPGIRSAVTANKVVDPEIIEWLTQGAREPEGPTRAEYYLRAQRKIIEKTYAIPIYVLLYNLVTADRVHGVVIDSHGFPEFRDAWLEG